jgi:hypothetical protein
LWNHSGVERVGVALAPFDDFVESLAVESSTPWTEFELLIMVEVWIEEMFRSEGTEADRKIMAVRCTSARAGTVLAKA